jgi:hypothetical protein
MDGLAQGIDQHVEAATVGHADDDPSTPLAPPVRIASSMATISDSPPSSEKRFWPTYLVCR